MTWQQAESLLIPAQLFFAMFGMGATLSLADFLNVLRNPSGVMLGVGLQWAVVPLLGLAITKIFGLAPGWALGIFLVTVMPGGAFSNLLTFFGKGHLPLSIAVTLVATLACVFTSPLLLKLLAASFLPGEVALPLGRVIFEVMLYLVVPLGLGMLVYSHLSQQARRISQAAIWISMTMVLVIAGGSLFSGKMPVTAYGWVPPLVVLTFSFANHYLAAAVAYLLRRTDDEVVALSVEVSVRNGGVGLLLLQFFFVGQPEQGHALYTILFYVGVQILVPIPTLVAHRLRRSPLWLLRPRPGRFSPGGEPGSP